MSLQSFSLSCAASGAAMSKANETKDFTNRILTPGQGGCDRRDSNPHGLPHQLLRLARLPIPPRSRTVCEMYLSRVLLSSLSSFWSHIMVRTRSSIVLAVAIGAAVFTRPAAGQASQDKDKVCSQVQNRALAVGTWSTYTWTGGSTNGSTMR